MKTTKKQKNIPDGWKYTRLGEIGNAYIGLTYSPRDVSDSGTLVLRSSNIKAGKISYLDTVFVKKNDISHKNIVQEGDILICARNGSKRLIGKNALIKKADSGHAFGAFMSVFRTENYKYIYQLFQSQLYKREIERDLGPTINQVTTGNLLKFKFIFPPLPEQNRIVAILETWDSGIEKLKQKIAIKKEIKKGLMQELLTGKKRLPGFDGEWKNYEIGNVLDYEQPTNYLVSSTDYSNEFKTPVLTAGKTFLLGYTAEKDGLYDKGPVIIFDDFTTANKYVDFEFKVKSSAMKMLTAKEGFNLEYLFERMQLLNLPSGEHKRRYLSEYQYLACKIPSKTEQDAITEITTSAKKEITNLESKLKYWQEQKKYLLNNLVTGQIRTPENLLETIN